MSSPASSASARSTAAPAWAAWESRASPGSRVSTTADAPASSALGAKSLPSTRSPPKATKSPPRATFLESIATPETRASPEPETSAQPVAATMSETEQQIMQQLLLARPATRWAARRGP